jgi:hypothetical protein
MHEGAAATKNHQRPEWASTRKSARIGVATGLMVLLASTLLMLLLGVRFPDGRMTAFSAALGTGCLAASLLLWHPRPELASVLYWFAVVLLMVVVLADFWLAYSSLGGDPVKVPLLNVAAFFSVFVPAVAFFEWGWRRHTAWEASSSGHTV